MSNNLWLSGVVQDTAANRPAVPDFPGLQVYYETDTGVVSVYTGTVGGWVVLNSGAPASGLQAAVTAGTTQTLVGATQLIGGYAKLGTVANSGDAVKLPPTPRLGQSILVTNAGANPAAVFPGESTSQIDAVTAGSSATLTNVKSALFTCTVATAGAVKWTSIGMATRSA